MIRDVLDVARRELGKTESPAGSNRTPYGKWMGLDGQPWCMSFVQWCFDRAGAPLPCRTGSCSALLAWYRSFQPERVLSVPQSRDIVIYSFGHTGIVESAASGTITVIEGNTSAGENGSQDNGGGVFRRTRSKSLAAAYIRPLQKEEEEIDIETMLTQMNGAQAYALIQKAQMYAASLPAPDWAMAELQEAVSQGITDGTAPMQLIPRCQAAIMALRAKKRG